MRERNYKAYHESITMELLAARNRVRYFIGNRHWGEDGRYKEVLLINYLKKILPANVSVGTGFVRNGNEVTKQIDIIVFDNSIPTLFSAGDFVIVLPESVYGIIEVKSNLRESDSIKAIVNAHLNGEVIDKPIFNGIFSYESNVNFNNEPYRTNSRKWNSEGKKSIRNTLYNYHGRLNHISFGENIFVKYWCDHNPFDQDGLPCYSFYDLKNLAFGFFISNLIEYIHIKSRSESLSDTLVDFLYPTQKEDRRLEEFEIKIRS